MNYNASLVSQWRNCFLDKKILEKFGLTEEQFLITPEKISFDKKVYLILSKTTGNTECYYNKNLIFYLSKESRITPLFIHLFVIICFLETYSNWFHNKKTESFDPHISGHGTSSNALAVKLLSPIKTLTQFEEQLSCVTEFVQEIGYVFDPKKMISFNGKESTKVALDGSVYKLSGGGGFLAHVEFEEKTCEYEIYIRDERTHKKETILFTKNVSLVYLYLLTHWHDYFGFRNVLYFTPVR